MRRTLVVIMLSTVLSLGGLVASTAPAQAAQHWRLYHATASLNGPTGYWSVETAVLRKGNKRRVTLWNLHDRSFNITIQRKVEGFRWKTWKTKWVGGNSKVRVGTFRVRHRCRGMVIRSVTMVNGTVYRSKPVRAIARRC